MPCPVQGIVIDDLQHRAVAQRQLLSVHGIDTADLLRKAGTGEVEFVQQLLLRWGKCGKIWENDEKNGKNHENPPPKMRGNSFSENKVASVV